MGALYVVATPIGNLDDWTHRAEAVLRAADGILCEDTRHTRKLLSRYGIQGKLESCHDYNEAAKADALARRIARGASLALVSDSGTPTVSDPGYRVVRACRSIGAPVVPVPGASALTAALSVSGLPTDAFLFVGFLPPRKDARRRRLESLRSETATLVFYEAPHRLRAALSDMRDLLGDRTAFLGREMTKFHEEYVHGPIGRILERVSERGESVIVVEGAAGTDEPEGGPVDLSTMTRPAILKLAAQRLGVGRKQLYDALFRK